MVRFCSALFCSVINPYFYLKCLIVLCYDYCHDHCYCFISICKNRILASTIANATKWRGQAGKKALFTCTTTASFSVVYCGTSIVYLHPVSSSGTRRFTLFCQDFLVFPAFYFICSIFSPIFKLIIHILHLVESQKKSLQLR